ncbi:MAG: hypothetical protein D6698_06395 [Gammaproteobacteria bacterium]|nr:MAG: hypothetical protein D6698_06395 [Gammaproteobacteria bacterium]
MDFRAYDSETLTAALVEYIRQTFPEEFNDWIASSEFIMMVEILAWLHQNVSYRVDLNARENLLPLAERRESLLRLAHNVGYKVNRVRPATGFMKVVAVKTTQDIVDSNDENLASKTIYWADPRNEDWFEQFLLVLNNAFLPRTQFSYPFARYTANQRTTETYLLSSVAPPGGVYSFTTSVNGISMSFDLYNGVVDEKTGVYKELDPLPDNVFSMAYRDDGAGVNSSGTGFYLPFKQGQLSYHDVEIIEPLASQTIDLNTNVNETDIFVVELDQNENVVDVWERVDTVYGESVSFTSTSGTHKIYEVDTLPNDGARLRFGDGTFGQIPQGRFRIWYRTSYPNPIYFRKSDFKGIRVTIPYLDREGRQQKLTLTLELGDVTSAGIPSETNLSIRNRVGKVFYTQNRMITAADYNNMYLRDNSIRKVKVVNRSFAGQSRYTRLYEATGIYDNVQHYASDGRIFKDYSTTVQVVSANTSIIPTATIISKYVQPILNDPGKDLLYREAYPMIPLTNITTYVWREDSTGENQKSGHIEASGNSQKVGQNATGELSLIVPDSILRTKSYYGPVYYVTEVKGDGSGTNGITLGGVDIVDGEQVFAVLPPMRTILSDTERTELESRLARKQSFGMSWDQTNAKWLFISASNLDTTSDFSIANQGDTSGLGKDASWMVRFEIENTNTGDNWRIISRNLQIGFESAEELDFVLANTDAVVDPVTGKSLQDRIVLLPCNESKNSINRLGINSSGASYTFRYVFTFAGDGTSTEFEMNRKGLEPERLIVLLDDVLQVKDYEYTVTEGLVGTKVIFTSPPPDGSSIFIMYATDALHATINRYDITLNGVDRQYVLPGVLKLNTDNAIVTLDGVTQESHIDFGIRSINTGIYLTLDDALSSGVVMRVHTLEDISTPIFSKSETIADGIQTTYQLYGITETSQDGVFVTFDGVAQVPSLYTYDDTTHQVTFTNPPPFGSYVRIWALRDRKKARSINLEYTADGTTKVYQTNVSFLKDATNNGDGVMVFLDGVLQAGPKDVSPAWQFGANGDIEFFTTPVGGQTIQIFAIISAVGFDCDAHGSSNDILDKGGVDVISANDLDNANYDLEFPLVSFFGRDVPFNPVAQLRHVDGYTNPNGLFILPEDRNTDARADFPFIFNDIVVGDGKTDLVLWRKVMVGHTPTWQPLDETTTPRGFYGDATKDSITENSSFDTTKYVAGDIYHDVKTEKWLVADANTGKWVAADPGNYKKKIGRSGLKFAWTHYASQDVRIDPSISNVMDVFILTTGYHDAYQRWLLNNDPTVSMPVPESPSVLETQFSSFLDLKPVSDSIVYHPVRMKPLFGPLALPELQANIIISQTRGSTISESDLKLKILNTINDFFSLDRWELGETLYMSELISYIHQQVAPHLQSIRFEPKDLSNSIFSSNSPVIRAEPDELFVSAATSSDIIVGA